LAAGRNGPSTTPLTFFKAEARAAIRVIAELLFSSASESAMMIFPDGRWWHRSSCWAD
jgi:hypothetical protein